MDFFKTQLSDDQWTIYLVDDDDHVTSDADAAAHTDFNSKEMFFRKGEISQDVILHELWHAYFGYCYLMDTTELSLSDMEEVSASLFADKAEKIINKAREIEIKLIELRDMEKPDET
jgi:ABC-type transporter Mla MlaB component